jgi:hypothetical protein
MITIRRANGLVMVSVFAEGKRVGYFSLTVNRLQEHHVLAMYRFIEAALPLMTLADQEEIRWQPKGRLLLSWILADTKKQRTAFKAVVSGILNRLAIKKLEGEYDAR